MAQLGEDSQVPRDMTLGIAANVLAGVDRPVVRIAVEGVIGSGKTALLAIIQEALQGKVDLYVENEYTLNELGLEEGTDRNATLAMYNPVVLLCERLTPVNIES